MAARPSPLDRLNGVNFTLVHNDPMQDVQACLRALGQAITDWHATRQGLVPMTICDTPVVYASDYQRRQKWDLYFARNPAVFEAYAAHVWDEECRAFGLVSDAVFAANQRNSCFYMASLQNPVFSHSWNVRHFDGQDTAAKRAQFYTGDIEWHEFVLVLSSRRVRPLPPWPCPPLLALACC
jgi:hypothetical protein